MSITTAKKKFDPKAAGAHPKAVRATVVEHLATPTAGAFIQRTPGCACGGGCPRCQGEPGLQPKLNIGQPNDKYEQEADQVADHVMRMAAPDIQRTPTLSFTTSPSCGSQGLDEEILRASPRDDRMPSIVQRQEEPEEEDELLQTKALADTITPLVQRQVLEEEDELLQTKALNASANLFAQRQPIEEEEEETLQAKSAGAKTPLISPTTQQRIQSLRGGGQPLPEGERAFFESRFGYDFSDVRIHTNPPSVQAAQSVNARAFTVGKDIVFGAAQYTSPGTRRGRHLLAHELAHVIQQANTGDRQIQRRARRRTRTRRAASIPTLTARRTRQFFADLNSTINSLFGKNGAASNLSLKDYKILAPAAYVTVMRKSLHGRSDYRSAKKQAEQICRARSPQLVRTLCGTDGACIRYVRKLRGNRMYCIGNQPTDLLISLFLTERGFLPQRGGRSVVIREFTTNPMLFLLIHEGMHRLQGTVWKYRSRPGAGIRYYHSRTRKRLHTISTWLDEGTVQILSLEVVKEMQKIRRRKWFRGYTSSAYLAAVQKVLGVLTKRGKTKKFLAKAFFAKSSTREVEDLQSWQ